MLADCCEDLEATSKMVECSNGNEVKTLDDVGTAAKRKRPEDSLKSRKKRGSAIGMQDTGEDGKLAAKAIHASSALAWRRSQAASLVLSALRRCFQSDRSGFVDKARFDLLMPAIVSQLECGANYFSDGQALVTRAGGDGGDVVAACKKHADELVGPCLAQLAVASAKDALWKAAANAVLMKTRSGKPGVRVAALVTLRQCFEVVGEEFLALLPECLPFLSELLEVSWYISSWSVLCSCSDWNHFWHDIVVDIV